MALVVQSHTELRREQPKGRFGWRSDSIKGCYCKWVLTEWKTDDPAAVIFSGKALAVSFKGEHGGWYSSWNPGNY